MGSCIICGTPVDGRICDIHEEDVVFEFRGTSPDQLTPNRFYRGTVDGFAEFGVFVDIGPSVTGLLHRSELDRRLESLDWDPGDTVFVQVQHVRDNGNVDLGWSIRQSADEFRGTMIDDPDRDGPVPAEDDADEESESTVVRTDATASSGSETDSGSGPDTESGSERDSPTEGRSESAAIASASGTASERGGSGDGAQGSSEAGGAVVETPELVAIETLQNRVGDRVRLEGVVESIHQTSGPTVFTLRDQTGTVECAAFEEAGVRAYPAVDEGDVARFEGEVEKRRGDLQLETEALVVLEAEERSAVEERLADAIEQQARPESVEPLVEDPAVEALAEDLTEAATAIRRAVFEDRPIVLRHAATADGYVGGVALERAILPLVRQEHPEQSAAYHYFDRKPLEGSVYDLSDATKDVTTMLDNRERHGEKLPLFVFVAAGGTRESADGFELLDIYGADALVVDDVHTDDAIADAVDALVTPAESDVPSTTATVLAANVAAAVNDDIRSDLRPLPAISYWEDAPEAYQEAASEAGYDETTTREIREAVALEAYYQSYEDKRELITDLLFGDHSGDGPGGLAAHVSQQFRSKLTTAVETAEANLDTRTVGDAEFAVLDTDAFTHRYEFPPTTLLLDELFRRHRDDVDALVGVSDSELHLRTRDPVDIHAVVDEVDEAVPDAGLLTASAHEGTVEYLAGERDAVLEAVLESVAERL